MFDPLTMKIAAGIVLGILTAACLLCLVGVFLSTKGLDETQPRSWRAIRGSTFGFGACVGVFLISERLMGTGGLMALLNPFLIPVVITAKMLLVDISKPKPPGRYLATASPAQHQTLPSREDTHLNKS